MNHQGCFIFIIVFSLSSIFFLTLILEENMGCTGLLSQLLRKNANQSVIAKVICPVITD